MISIPFRSAFVLISMLLVLVSGSSGEERPEVDVTVVFGLRNLDGGAEPAVGVLDVGAAAGVVVGGRRTIYRITEAGDSRNVGEAVLLSVASDSSVVAVHPHQGELIADGDLVDMLLRVPRPERDQLAWRLAGESIVLVEGSGRVLLDGVTVFADPGSDHDTPLLTDCAAMLREIVPYLEDWELLDTRPESGRYADRTMREILEQAVPDDARSVLQFMVSYPGSYMARTWKIENIFVQWVQAGAPTSYLELLHRAADTSPDDLGDLLTPHLDAITVNGMPGKWHGEVWRLIHREEYARTRVPCALIRRAAELADVDDWWLMATDAAANVAEKEGDLEGAVALWGEGLDRTSPEAGFRHVSLGNMSDALRQLERWDEAAARYGEILELDGALESPPGSDATAYAWLGMGRVRAGQHRNEEAAEAFGHAATVFRRRGSLSDTELAAQALSQRGDALEEIGRYREAIDTWLEGLELARELDWTASVASALGDVSDGYWSLGELDKAVTYRREAAELYEQLGDDYQLAVEHTNLASLSWTLGATEEARRLTDQALASHLSREEWWDAGDVLERQGRRERERGNHHEALELLERALEAYAHGHWPDDEASTGLEKAEALEGLGYYARADSAYAASREAYQAADAPSGEAQTIEWWAYSILARKGAPRARAGELLEDALTIRRRLGDLGGQSDGLRMVAAIRQYAGAYDEALALADSSLALARSMPSKSREAESLNTAGRCLWAMGRIDEAFDRIETAVSLAEDIGDRALIVKMLQSLGQLREHRGDMAEARRIYGRCVQVAADADLDGDEANALGSLAWVDHVDGRNEEAAAHAERALSIYGELDNEWATSTCYNTLASVAHARGEYDEAIATYRRSLAIDTAWNDPFGIAAAENNLGGVYRDMRDFETAAEHFRRARDLGERYAFMVVQCVTGANLARCAMELGDPDAAIAHADMGLVVARTAEMTERVSDLTMIRGRLLRQMGRYDEAERDFAESLAIALDLDRPLGLIRVRHELGVLAWERRDLQTAADRLTEAAESARDLGLPPMIWEPELYLARVRRDAGDVGAAEASYRRSMAALESIRGSIDDDETADAFRSRHDEVYRELVDLLVAQGRQEEAWEVLGSMKSQELRELAAGDADAALDGDDRDLVGQARDMTSREVRLTRLLSDELKRPESERRAELVQGWRAEIDSLRLRFHDFVGALRDDRPDLYARVEVEPVTFRQLQRGLQRDEAFVEPVVLPDRVVIFVVRGGDVPLIYREVDASEDRVDDLVRRMRSALEHPDGDWETRGLRRAGSASPPTGKDPSSSARELHALLVDPILGDLDGVTTVILSPSGRLRYIPFAALYDGERYLIDRFDLAVLTQAGTLSPRDPVAPDASLLALGDPDGSLPGAVQEIRRLEELWDPAPVTAIVGADATKDTLRHEIERHAIVHLATHGVLRNDLPEASYLLMAGEDESTNLSMRDIILLSLWDVDLTVLSACQTAVGEHGVGAEIAGLAYNFEQSGAASIIASLWEVSDVSTSVLMTDLYTNLRTNESTKANALSSAQRTLRRDPTFSHPFHWAPFILIGNWR